MLCCGPMLFDLVVCDNIMAQGTVDVKCAEIHVRMNNP